jgi:DNA gyrase subunit A
LVTENNTGHTRPIHIEEEMKNSYLDYAMSVIVARALPDIRDGLKPVQRRILYTMDGLNLRHSSSYKKSARIVGDCMGKFHPHGDSPIYEAMVRMAQDFSMRYTLVDGQGNFGSVDNDPAAAMRYTEARLSGIADEMLADIDKDTVEFLPNFDNSMQEPSILPAKIPNLLVNGSAGIAVGMATNIPPHNLTEICQAVMHVIDNPDASLEDLMRFVKGPDFPTGGIIQGRGGIMQAYATGQGKVVVRAKVEDVEVKGGRHHIIITELPYQINKAALVERIYDLMKGKKIDGISEVRDESDRQGMRVVIELKRDGQPNQVLNNLFKHTSMQSAFYVNMVALVDGQPRVLNLKDALTGYIEFRRLVITRRTQFDLGKAKDRAHILEGFRIALTHIDEIIAVIRKSETPEAARTNLMENFKLSQVQAQAILDMQLRRLARLEQNKINDEYAEVIKTIAYLEDLLANPRKILNIISQEAKDLIKKYGDERRTAIIEEEVQEFSDEDLIQHQRVVVTMSNQDYIKRYPIANFRVQRRGGKGVIGMVTREADIVRDLVVADTHDNLLLFTDRGRVYRLKVWQVPQELTRTTKGTALQNLVSIDLKEHITTMLTVPEFVPEMYLFMVTAKGTVKRTALQEYASVRSNGLIAISLKPNDELVATSMVTGDDEISLVTRDGNGIRFPVGEVRPLSRTAAGVRGIRLAQGDRVVGMDVVNLDACLITVTENGFGKLTRFGSYRVTHRGGQGVIAHKINFKTGKVAAARLVMPDQQITILSSSGNVIRTTVQDMTVRGRSTQGVYVMRLDQGDKVAAIAPQEGELEARGEDGEEPAAKEPKAFKERPAS